MDLIIVESPTKANTLTRFLGKGFSVGATMGHIADLPKSKLGVDIKKHFEPQYEPIAKKQDVIDKIIGLSRKAKKVYIATDPDREGEAIAAHIADIIRKNVKNKKISLSRIAFHEITKEALEEAMANPREIDKNLVNAQIARRVLDRIVGYKLSPLLWKKVRRGLSAGRVQTVAVRLIVEKEEEIEKFKPQEYWEISCLVKSKNAKANTEEFVVQLTKVNDKKAEIKNKKKADKIVGELNEASYLVSDIQKREVVKKPLAPFTTSTMSQAAARIMGWSAKRTMNIAQTLYEEGLITYHRTDSTNLAKSAVEKLRSYIGKEYGEKYLSGEVKIYKTASKSAQEAHEAIRPTSVSAKFEIGNSKVAADAKRLYDLVWKQYVACQMADGIYDETRIEVEAKAKETRYLLSATGLIMKFEGWKILYNKQSEDVKLPEVDKGEALQLIKVLPEQKFTMPPARYTEAMLIKTLEKLGIGRPSTYAPIISTIQIRQYVEKKEGKFFATPVGIAVNNFLIPNFENVFDCGFTAKMEDSLDEIANGKAKWKHELEIFYTPFEKILNKVESKAKRVKIATEKLGKKCPLCKKGELVIRIGRFGKFVSCSLFPECKFTDKYIEKINMKCPECKTGEVIIKKSFKGRNFFGCSRYPECKWASWRKPETAIKEEK